MAPDHRTFARALPLFVAMLALLFPTLTQAQSQRVYIVADAIDPELEAVAQRAAAAARASLRSVPDADWVAADQRFLGYGEAALANLERARTLLEEGRAAYLDLNLEQAIASLEESVTLFDSAVGGLEDPTDLGNALLFLGASQSFNGDNRGAQRTFSRLHIQMPYIVPDEQTFPPDVISRYEQSRPRRTDSSIVVESDPPGATVYVDFIARGVTPMTVTDLARGDHIVRVTRPGAIPYVEPVTTGRRASTVNAFLMDAEGNEGLADVVAGITGQGLESADGPVQEVGQMLELDKIAVLRVSYGDSQDNVRIEMVIFDVHSGRRLLRGEVQAPREINGLASAVQSAVSASMERVLRPVVVEDNESPIETQAPVEEEEDEGGAITQKWWFWAAVGGVVVVGAAVGIALAAGGRDELGTEQGGQVVLEF